MKRGAPIAGASALSALGFDPNAVLLREPGVLLDPSFLGALHAELEEQLGAEEAATVLLQIGLLHGMQDAARALGDVEAAGADPPVPLAPPLAIRFRTQTTAGPPGGLEIRGSWPECSEASARLSRVGACAHPSCWVSAGYTSGWLSGCFDAEILAVETSCSAMGQQACVFIARECEAWRAGRDPRTLALLEAVPFEAFRELLRSEPVPPPVRVEAESIETESSLVHIWGPVMVVPYSGPEEVLRAIDLMGHDPAAAEVSVVVLDLSGAIVDEAFGAAALEQLVETVENWGADVIFASVSPLSEPVIAELERPPLMIHKDVPQAVAVAFQIAAAQRRMA